MGNIRLEILLRIILLFMIFLSSVTGKQCLKDPRCYCNKTKSKNETISCYNVDNGNIQSINSVLKNFTSVYKLRIFGYYLKVLPNNSFENQDIKVLEISSPLIDIEDFALSSIKNLTILNLNGTSITSVPKAISLPQLIILEMTHGSLKSIEDELNLTSVKDVLFSFNQIDYISENAFHNVIFMENLDLSHNKLKALNKIMFDGLVHLKDLNLAYNQLQVLIWDFNLPCLEVLVLYHNNLTEVEFKSSMSLMGFLDLGGNPNLNLTGSNFGYSMLHLATLSLNDNQFTDLDPHLIAKFPYFQNLYLNNNSISSIPSNFFLYAKRLRSVELGNNKIKSMKNLFTHAFNSSLNITTILLDGNLINSVEYDDSFKFVSHLDLSKNQITFIPKEAFSNLTDLIKLNLSGNPITDIETDSFISQNHLVSLDLSFTNLTKFNNSIKSLSKLSYLYAEFSSLESLEGEFEGLEEMKYAYFKRNKLSTITKAFKTLDALKRLDISGNNLTTLINNSFSESAELWMEDNPWICNCRLLWIVSQFKKGHLKIEDNPLCQSPINLQGKEIKELNQISLEYTEQDCPEVCSCECVLSEDSIFTTANCSNKNLQSLPDLFPQSVQNVDLRANKLTAFDGFFASKYPNLQSLQLENNQLREFKLEVASSFSALFLSQNNLSRVPFEEWNHTNFKQITLSRNPWTCDCETWKFSQWLRIQNSSILDLNDIKCGNNEKFSNEVIIKLKYEDLCPKLPNGYHLSLIIIVILSGPLLLICIVLYFVRKFLAVLLFACGCNWLKPQEKENYLFDAFLLYADEDDEFALGVIADGLEVDSYKLFVPTRQILLTSSPVAMNSSIDDCCKVIVLLTSNFLRDAQCVQLMKTAMSCSLQNTSKRFIFITMKNLPLELGMDGILNAVVKNSVCLKWGELLFWSKLKYSLPKQTKVLMDNDEEEERLIQY